MPLKAEGISHFYPGRASPALDAVSLDIKEGELVVICGKNGSGKSTLLHCLAGLARPSKGRTTIDGQAAEKSRRDIGLAIQFPERALFARTVYDEVAFGPQNMGMPSENVKRLTECAIGAVGIARESLTATPRGLSYGQKRLVAIAGAIAHNPRYLFLDEPAAGLDYPGRARIARLIRELNASGTTIVVASHDPVDLLDSRSRLIVLDRGRIVADGPTSMESLELAGIRSDTMELAIRLRECGVHVGNVFMPEALADSIMEARK